MNKAVKFFLLIVGIALVIYGVYEVVNPETKVSIGELDLIENQDNTNAYIFIGLGLLAVILSFFKGRK
jgi:hypothetical protein